MKTVLKLVTKSLGTVTLTVLFVLPARPAEPGQRKWSFAAGGPVHSSPAIGVDGTVYVGSNDNRLYALDGATGAQKWVFASGGMVVSSPAVGADGTVYVGSGDRRVYALDGATGAQRWAFATDGSVLSSPALGADGTVYVGSNDNKFYALDGATGAQKWTFGTRVQMSSAAIGADGTVYVGSTDGRAYALSGATGAQKWAFDAYDPVSSPAIAGDGTVYIVKGKDDGITHWWVYALDGATGASKWQSALGPGVGSSPAVGTDGTVYVGSGDGKLHAYDGATGTRKWAFPTGGGIRSSPAIAADGTIYFGSNDGKVYAIDGLTGSQEWEFVIGCLYGNASSPTIGADGTVYVGSSDGRLYALQGSRELANSAWPKFRHDVQNSGAVGVPASGPPVLLTEPVDGRFVEGSTATVWVRATGGPPLQYQWFFQSSLLPAATNSILRLPNCHRDNTGDYFVTVSNGLGAAASRTARVTIGFGLAVTNRGPGTVVVTPPLAAYDPGSTVQLRAVPNPGNQFVRWSGDVATSANPLTLTVNGSLSLVAEFSLAPGALIWVFAAGGGIYTSPALSSDGTVYFGCKDNRLYAVDGINGTLKWTFVTDGGAASSPAVGADGTVYVGSDDKNVYALHGATGVKKWAFATGADVRSCPAVGPDGTVYVGSFDHNVYALDGATGARRWSFTTGNLVSKSAVLGADGTVYVGSLDGKVYALDSTTGTLRWASAAGDSTAALGADGTVYVGWGYRILALDPATGGEKWASDAYGSFLSPVIGPGGTIYLGVGGSNGGIHALDGATGVHKWSRQTTEGGEVSSPVVGVGSGPPVYVGFKGRLYALNGATGEEKWSVATGNIRGSPAVAPDGTVYVGASDGRLYAVQGYAVPGPGGLANSPWPKFGHDAQNRGAAPMSGPPLILTEPVDRRAVEGSTVSLSVRATGQWPLDYQWFFNGTPLSQATCPVLALTEAQLNNTGGYSVTVSNSLGVATSRAARLDVGFGLTVTNKGAGTITVTPALAAYDPGSPVELRAVPKPGCRFSHWSGDVTSSANPLTLTLNGHLRVVAEFSFSPGDVVWSFTTGAAVTECPALAADGTVYVASDKLYALDNATGALKWTVDIGSATSAPMIGPDGTLYVGGGSKLYALDGFTGSQKWSRAITDWPLWPMRLALGPNATVYVSDRARLQALATGTGTPKWTMTVDPLSDGYLVNGPAIGFDDTVYVCSRTPDDPREIPLPINSVRAVDGLSGKTKWVTKEISAYFRPNPSSPVIAGDGTLYVGWWADEGGISRLFAFDGATGVQKWASVLGGQYMSPAVVGSDGTVFICSGFWAPSGIEDGGFVEALDGATGAKRWTFVTRCDVLNSPALAADGTVYVCLADTRLQALDGALGTLKWSFTAGGALGSPTIGVDGTVYVGSAGGKVYALQGSVGLADSPWPKFQHDARNTGAAIVPVTGRPVIETQPADGLFVEGSTASLWVQATGASPLSFQWFFQNVPMPAATNSALTLANLQFSKAGNYYVEVRNPVGVETSRVARVTVGFGLIVTTKGVGTVAISPALTAYEPGSSVELRALPAAGRQFVQWSGDVTSSANPLTLTINRHLTVVAEFSFLPGDMIWAFATGGEVGSTPAIGADGTVYVGSRDRKVYALDGGTGTLKWSFATDWQITSSAALGADGTVYIASYALDGVTGRKLLAFADIGSPFSSSPALGADGTVYVASYALDGVTGTRKWTTDTYGLSWPAAAAIAADGTVYHGMYSLATSPPTGRIYALDGATGAQRWFFAAGNSVLSSPAVGADGTIYFGSSDRKVYALNGATGVQRWAFVTGGEVESSAAVDADGTVYIGSHDGNVYALDGMSGVRKWAFATGGGVGSSPAIAADGTVYVGSWDGKVYALDATTGAQKWAFIAGSGVGSSPAIGADGTVYIGSSDGKVYGLKGSAGLANSPWPKMGADARNTGRSDSVPWVFEQPAWVVLKEGEPGRITVKLDVVPRPDFRWFRNGQPIPSPMQPTFTIWSVTRADEGIYTVVASNAVGQATSEPIAAVVSNLEPLRFVGLKWEGGNLGPVNLETAAQLGALAAWHSISNYPPNSGTQLYVETDPADAARFYRLNARPPCSSATRTG